MYYSCSAHKFKSKKFNDVSKILTRLLLFFVLFSKAMSSSANSPCAACKMQRRKCTQDCVFAPYFPPDQPQKFADIHKVFGASNVSKILNELNAAQREDAVNSLAYEAEYRLRDPVYGCVGLISVLQHRLKQIQRDLSSAKRELATYIGPNALAPLFPQPGFVPNNNHNNNHNPSSSGAGVILPYNMHPQMIIQDPHPHQQLMIGEPADMFRAYDQQPQPLELMGLNNGGFESGGPVTATGYHQSTVPTAALSPSLALGSYLNACYPFQEDQSHPHDHTQSVQLQPQQLILQQEPPQLSQPQQNPETQSEEEGRSVGHPSC
ncbi:unnamed protein product [Cuscuta europaea]|uniref:LOB domain-containing protein n=1 Tax=Cuscuta europaea TaxID=41803 RepID=A0A9P1E0A6_CUSEU|nr:unnamed protein product [Cuscuta europaea]